MSSCHCSSMAVFRGAGQEDRAGASASMTFLPPCMAHQLAHCVQWRYRVCMHMCLLITPFQWKPCEEDEEETQKLEAGCQAKVNKPKGRHIILPTGSMNTTVLLPEHTGGVNHCAKIYWSRDIGWRRTGNPNKIILFYIKAGFIYKPIITNDLFLCHWNFNVQFSTFVTQPLTVQDNYYLSVQ